MQFKAKSKNKFSLNVNSNFTALEALAAHWLASNSLQDEEIEKHQNCKQLSTVIFYMFLKSNPFTPGFKIYLFPGQVSQLVAVLSSTPYFSRFNSWLGNTCRLWVWYPVEVCMGSNCSVFLSYWHFSLSPPPPLSIINNYILG